MKRLSSLIIFILLGNNLYCQTNDSTNFEERPTSIKQVIKHLDADTVVFYYNNRWQLVKPVCATIFRITRVDPVLGIFTGEFIDYYSTDSTKAIEGNYLNRKKEGKFNFYFPNGQLAQTGNYIDDNKSGVWEYFYENGNKKQTLDFQNNEIIVKEFLDENGNKLVESGNGEWFTFDSSEKTSGNILNGRKHGTWKNTIPSRNMTTNIEKYKEGKFISGKMISVFSGTESYKDTLYCMIEKPLTFLTAEKFQISRCYKDQKNNWELAKYPGGMRKFYEEIKEKLVLNGPIITRGIIRVQITIDTDGKMSNFKPVSSIGHEYDLIRVLQTMSNWTPTKLNGKPMILPKIISFEIR